MNSIHRTHNLPTFASLLKFLGAALGFDLTKKAALYARAGIIEYWVLDVAARSLVVHREPIAGQYVWVFLYAEHETVAPLAAHMVEFRIADAFR